METLTSLGNQKQENLGAAPHATSHCRVLFFERNVSRAGGRRYAFLTILSFSLNGTLFNSNLGPPFYVDR